MDIDVVEIKPTEGMVTLTHVIYALYAFSAVIVRYVGYPSVALRTVPSTALRTGPSTALRTGSEQLTHD